MKALIAMSGGVDSSVAAYLTQHEGYTCAGGTMLLHDNTLDPADARAVAHKLGMELHIWDLSAQFRSCVMDRFCESYLQGLTPNPCIECNRLLKFGAFMDLARSIGCNTVVTGHYVRTAQLDNGRLCLQKAADSSKDQSYFLYMLTQDQLSHSYFPLGALTKAEVRCIAEKAGLINARKRDSQDICFIPDGDHAAFLRRHSAVRESDGDFLDLQGNVVGRHNGAAGYTLGQRKGLGLAMGAPVYVCGKDMAANTVTVGPNEALFSNILIAEQPNWMAFAQLSSPLRCKAKARSRMNEQPATITPLPDGRLQVEFDEPQRALTPGQAVVFYDGPLCIGGATIAEIPL